MLASRGPRMLRSALLLCALPALLALLTACQQATPTTPATTPTPTATTPAPTPTPTPTQGGSVTPTPSPGSQVVVPMAEVDGSGQSGTAVLTDMGAQTEVAISLTPGEANVPQPVHIHNGTCTELGGIAFPLQPITNGISTTVISVPMDALQAGRYAINAHLSAEEIGTYVACGNIPSMGVGPTPSPTPTPGG